MALWCQNSLHLLGISLCRNRCIIIMSIIKLTYFEPVRMWHQMSLYPKDSSNSMLCNTRSAKHIPTVTSLGVLRLNKIRHRRPDTSQ
jgi:hypothetical protein